MEPLPKPSSGDAIRPVGMRYTTDCGIACLATLLGQDYEVIEAEYQRLFPKRPRRGMWLNHVTRIAASFHVTLKKQRSYDLADDVGILEVDHFGTPEGRHLVTLFRESVWDPMDRLLWDPDAYLKNCSGARWGLLLRALH